MFNEIFGPSIYLLLLDQFLENPDMMANQREFARMISKNPGSISRVMPRLLNEGIVEQIKVGKVMYAYRLNKKKDFVKLLMETHRRLKDIYEVEDE